MHAAASHLTAEQLARIGLARAEPPWIIPVSWNAARPGSVVAAGDQDLLRQFIGPRE
jgi:hypothetical protein